MPRGGRSTDPQDYPAELSSYTLRAQPTASSAALPGRARRWLNSPTVCLDGPLGPGHGSGRGTSSSVWASATRPSAWIAACRQGLLEVDLIDVRRVERILLQALEQQKTLEHPPPLPTGRFARPGDVFAHGKACSKSPTEGLNHDPQCGTDAAAQAPQASAPCWTPCRSASP